MKRTFILLSLLSDLWKDDADWQDNVASSISGDSSKNGYTISDEEGEGGNVAEFSCDELEFVADGEIVIYDFMGSEDEPERFYSKEVDMIFKVKATGQYCILESDEAWDI